MAFNLVRISQQDPKWKDTKLGYSNLTLGSYGCAVTCVAMYLSGFGYPEDVASLNAKMKNKGGFVDAAIIWGAISAIYPKIKYKNLILCRDTDAPIDMIGDSVRAGQPVLLEVDSSPKSGLQTHWVVAYQKVGKDFLVLDPFPYPSDKGEVSLMARYSQGKELKRTITAAVFYECQGAGVPAPVEPPNDGGYYVRVVASLEAGLRLRSQPTTASDTVTIEPALTSLKVLEPEAGARAKVGVLNQWLNVGDANGMRGYVAAWYVENATAAAPDPSDPPVSDPPVVIDPPVVDPPASPPQRSRRSVAEGLENVNLAPAVSQLLNPAGNVSSTTRLVANIWNRYGGLLAALSARLAIQPGTAVAVLAIESGGQAFAADKRMVIRFENHIFYQQWGKTHASQFAQYFRFNVGQSWTGHQWRAPNSPNWVDCHSSQASEWDVFNFACSLDVSAARMSISMGAPQIMGFNYSVIGFKTVNDMFAAFTSSEREHVIGFFDFVVGILPGGGAVKALQRLDYKAFATSYNGTGQADYYANLMRAANNAFTALVKPVSPSDPLPDAPTEPPDPPVPVDPTPTTPETPPDDGPRMDVVVNNNVSKPGLNLRKLPSTTSQVLAVEPVGSRLRVLDDPTEARARIGKPGQWILVKDNNGRRGYVGAAYVREG